MTDNKNQPRTLKEKLQGFMPKIPDIGEITSMLDQRFEKLIEKLDEILQELKKQSPPS